MEPEFDLIAERYLTLSEDGDSKEVKIMIGRPYQEPDQAYLCPYRITGVGAEITRKAGGLDSIQALQLALVMIGGELARYSDSLKWDDESGIGLPASVHDPVLGS